MALLVVEHQGNTRGTKLPPRVLIGRRSMNHLVIDDATVSRMHAWIDRRGDDYVLTDMRSRTGTRVNGQPLAKRRKLSPGDVIEIGPARLTFQTGDRVPMDVEAFELPREPVMLTRDLGIRFDCPHCRAPMWASGQYAGHGGICTYCGDGFTIPRTVVNAAAKAAAAVPGGMAALAAADNAVTTTGTSQPHRPRAPGTAPKTPPIPPEYDARLMSLQVGSGSSTPVSERTREDSDSTGMARNGSHSVGSVLADAQTIPANTKVKARSGASAKADPTVRESPLTSETTPEESGSSRVRSDTGVETVARAPITENLATPPIAHETVAIAAPALFDAATTFVPAEPETYTEPPSVAGQYKCGVCHSPILAGESLTTCPSCNLRFHEECWQENYGCSAYGCPQVNALAPAPDPSAEPEMAIEDATIDMSPPRTPWEFVLLGMSALGAVASCFTFGAASLATLVWAFIYMSRSKSDPDRKTGPIVGAIALSVAGVAAGAAVSYFLFLYGRK